jgi:hypothetical protein
MLLCELFFALYFTGKDEISQIVTNLHVSGGETIINKAHCFYKVYMGLYFYDQSIVMLFQWNALSRY